MPSLGAVAFGQPRSAVPLSLGRPLPVMEGARGRGGLTYRAQVKALTTSHELTVAKLEDWLAGSARSPVERIDKERLKKILQGK